MSSVDPAFLAAPGTRARGYVNRGAEAEPAAGAPKATGRWTREEHYRFLEALKLFGKEWKKV